MKARLMALAIGALIAALALAACGGDDDGDGAGEQTTEESQEEIDIGVTMIGPRNDGAFSQAHVEAAKRAQAEIPGVMLTRVLGNRTDRKDQIDALETLAMEDDLVVAGSSAFAPAANELAPRFPKTWFIINGGGLPADFHENVTAIIEQLGLQAYVMGVLAAELSRTGAVGSIGGPEVPATVQALAGFRAGAEAHDPSIRVLKNAVGDFNDPAKANDAAKAMIADGADQIYGFLDDGIQGIYRAAEESGDEIDVYNTAEALDCDSYENTVATATGDDSEIVFTAIERFVDGTLKPGAIFLGLEQLELHGVSLCPRYEEDEDLAQLSEETIAALKDQQIELPLKAITPEPDYPFSRGFGE